jgi:hypothetical protein
LPNAQDEYYLINVIKFMSIVDENYLAQNESMEIIDTFHKYWFSRNGENEILFHPPEFYLEKGVARFINGRHRTLVLYKHMNEIPMALTNMDGYPVFADSSHQLSKNVLNNIAISKLKGDEVFDFPDLPIEYLGYDINLGK